MYNKSDIWIYNACVLEQRVLYIYIYNRHPVDIGLELLAFILNGQKMLPFVQIIIILTIILSLNLHKFILIVILIFILYYKSKYGMTLCSCFSRLLIKKL